MEVMYGSSYRYLLFQFQKVFHFLQEISENLGDITHFNMIHARSALGGSDIINYEKPWFKFARHIWSGSWEQSNTPGEEHTAMLHLRTNIRLFRKFECSAICADVKQVPYTIMSFYFKDYKLFTKLQWQS